MSRPFGSKNKTDQYVDRDKTLYPRPMSPVTIPKTTVIERTEGVVAPAIRYDAVFAVRNMRNGPFKGLWELVKLNADQSVEKVLTDANSRGMIITMITREILRIVVQSAPL